MSVSINILYSHACTQYTLKYFLAMSTNTDTDRNEDNLVF